MSSPFSIVSARPVGKGAHAIIEEHASWDDASHGSLGEVEGDPPHQHISLEEEQARASASKHEVAPSAIDSVDAEKLPLGNSRETSFSLLRGRRGSGFRIQA
jgi:hypothetical protein